MAKVAVLLPSLNVGGAERVMLNLSSGLAGRGLEVDMVLASAAGGLLPELDPRVHLVDLHARRVLSAIPALARYLRRARPDALLSSLPHLNMASILARRLARVRSRLVLVEHNDLAHSSAHGIRRWESIFPSAMHLLYPHADRVVAVSAGVANGLAQQARLRRSAIAVIYNPIVTPELARKAALPLDHPWFAPGQPPVILAAGRLSLQKDYPNLLRAFSILSHSLPLRLVILGTGELEEELKSLAQEVGVSDRVDFAGFDPNPWRFMARCGVFVLSSAWEGFGNVLVEAMACGSQVVSTDCPSGPAEILEGGRFGRLVPVSDPSALAAAIQQSLDHPLPSSLLVQRAQVFSVDAAVDQYMQVLGFSLDGQHASN